MSVVRSKRFVEWREKREWHAITCKPAFDENPARFEPGDPALLLHLREHGYAVVAGVMSSSSCKLAMSYLWDWLEAAAPKGPTGQQLLDRNDEGTWDCWPEGVEGGILPYFGAGQSAAAWFVRGQPRVSAGDRFQASREQRCVRSAPAIAREL